MIYLSHITQRILVLAVLLIKSRLEIPCHQGRKHVLVRLILSLLQIEKALVAERPTCDRVVGNDIVASLRAPLTTLHASFNLDCHRISLLGTST